MNAIPLLHELQQAGLTLSVTAEGLRVDGPADVRGAFRERIRAHKQELIAELRERGERLLRALWDGGYQLEIVRRGGRYMIAPRGAIPPTVALLDQFERDHDAAATALAEVCRRAGIDPEERHRVADRLETTVPEEDDEALVAKAAPAPLAGHLAGCGCRLRAAADARRSTSGPVRVRQGLHGDRSCQVPGSPSSRRPPRALRPAITIWRRTRQLTPIASDADGGIYPVLILIWRGE